MYSFLNSLIPILKKIVPRALVAPLIPRYHRALASVAAYSYRYPAREITVIGVTGTKGKSSVAEMLFAILHEAGATPALASTIRFAFGDDSRPNLYKMTMPGRGFIQSFLREAVTRKCTHAILEVTSESVLQSRHLYLDLNLLVFTNLQKEHLEAHGSFENYFRAKFEIGKELARSPKRPRTIVANDDDAHGKDFLALPVENPVGFRESELGNLQSTESGSTFTYGGIRFELSLPGRFNACNALAAIKAGEALGVPLEDAAKALKKLTTIKGRAERIDVGQDFLVVVDYAHTPDSLVALYDAYPTRRKICVLGNTGGGRDTWKRPQMGAIAEANCSEVILTNEDPYDEDPRAIVDAMARGMQHTPTIIMDRREAIRAALQMAHPGDAVLITGKGTDPYVMGPRGSKTPWSDARVAHEELERLRTNP